MAWTCWWTSAPFRGRVTTRSLTARACLNRSPRKGSSTSPCPAWEDCATPKKDSRNTGWRNLSFRGYADYMETVEFQSHLDGLLRLEGRQVAMMCAESVPWRCHRSLIADALAARGVPVRHIMSATRSYPHKLTSFARVEGTQVTYPSTGLDLFPV